MGKTKIPSDKIRGYSIDDDSLKSLTLGLVDLTLDKKSKQKIQNHVRQLKFYLKAIDSLDECNDTLRVLVSEFYDSDGACFIQGEKNRKPLGSLNEVLESAPFHMDLRKIADKLHTHFDKNSEVSSLEISWDFKLHKKNVYIPQGANRTSSRIDLLHLTSINEWLNLNNEIIDLLRDQINILSNTINNIIGDSFLIE